MKIAVIPARGGSKRIPRKNIKKFLGRPILDYSIAAAHASGCFDKVIVSTDDDEVAQLAMQLGAEIPFMRPAELANDYCATTDVIKHAIEWYESSGHALSYVCCIYATAPFLRPEDLRAGWQKISADNQLNYAFSITEFEFPIQRAVYLADEDSVAMFQPENYLTRSQDLVPAFHDAGQFYWGKSVAFKNNLQVFSPWSKGIKIPRERVQDIDTEEDWRVAEMKYQLLEQRGASA